MRSRVTLLILLTLLGGSVSTGLAGISDAAGVFESGTECQDSDLFSFIPRAEVVNSSDHDGQLADPSPLLLLNGSIRLYIFGGPNGGVMSWWSGDEGGKWQAEGARISPSDFQDLPKPNRHQRPIRLTNDSVRLIVGTGEGFISFLSDDDGWSFTSEEGFRLSNASGEMEQMAKLSPIQLKNGSWRSYYGNSATHGGFTPASIRSTWSPDSYNHTLETGILLGNGSAQGGSTREPYPLSRGNDCVTIFHTLDATIPTEIAYSTAADGRTFNQTHELGLNGSGSAVLVLPDQRMMFFHDTGPDTETGNQVWWGWLTFGNGSGDGSGTVGDNDTDGGGNSASVDGDGEEDGGQKRFVVIALIVIALVVISTVVVIIKRRLG